jgi:metal-responsive CopG/Arc/MetJ family transcriptional regulator
MRTFVDIPDDLIAELNKLAEREKVSRSALIRQAIAKLLAARKAREDAIAASFGIWSDMQEDSLDYQNRLRGEW